jgi:mono/diheme cytochrome c family protein
MSATNAACGFSAGRAERGVRRITRAQSAPTEQVAQDHAGARDWLKMNAEWRLPSRRARYLHAMNSGVLAITARCERASAATLPVRLRALAVMLACAAIGCEAEATTAHAPAPAAPTPGSDVDVDLEKTEDRSQWPDALAASLHGEAQRENLCARAGDDSVRDLFCGPDRSPDGFSSLTQLQAAIGLDAAQIGGLTGVSVSAHSTGLSARSVSAINPRAIAVRLEITGELFALSYVRGEQTVEFAVRDRSDHELRFYLLRYRSACDDAADGCKPGDLLTPATETDWTETSLYDEDDLAGTILDCRSCHQPNGPASPKLLRMQELTTPWTHWLFKSSRGGQALIADYTAAHGDEVYAGMPADRITASHPENLSMLVILDDLAGPQPNEFDSTTIEGDVMQSASSLGCNQPEDNSVAGDSATWRRAYEATKRGDAIPVPYLDVKVTDAAKLAAMSQAYAAFRSGTLAAVDLPDIREVFPDDPLRLAEMGFASEPGLAAAQVLTQACAQCHNDRLDQALSRARFNVDLSRLSRVEKDLAIARLNLPASSLAAMPPRRVRTLGAEARTALIALLRE